MVAFLNLRSCLRMNGCAPCLFRVAGLCSVIVALPDSLIRNFQKHYHSYKLLGSRPVLEVVELEFILKLKKSALIGYLRPQGYKTFFVLNSAEHEISTVN